MPQLTISEIAHLCGARIEGPGEGSIRALAGLGDAQEHEASFLADARYRSDLEKTAAGCVLIGLETPCERTDLTLLRCADPSGAFSTLIEAFAPPIPKPEPGIHASAVVEGGAQVHATAVVGPLCYVAQDAQVQAGAVLHARVTVGAGCQVGADSVLHPGVVLYPGVRIEERCVIHAGTVLGSDGFGFNPTAAGWSKIRQGGSVVIEDDVEMGANCTVDCGRFGNTTIGAGSKLDNLIHIGHNTRVGANSLLIAQVGVAGSTHLGKGVILAGQVGVGGHLKLADGVRVGAGSRVLSDLDVAQDYFGTPAGPKPIMMRAALFLPRVREEVRRLKQRIAKLEKGS